MSNDESIQAERKGASFLASRLSGVLAVILCTFHFASMVCDDRKNDTSQLKIMTFIAGFLFDGVAREVGGGFPRKNSREEAIGTCPMW